VSVADVVVERPPDVVARRRVALLPGSLPPVTRRLMRQVILVASVVMLLLVTDGQPWRLFASGDFSSDFYDAQAEALTHGRLAVDPAVAAIEGIVQGEETHIYYGLLLAIVRMPVAFVTDGLSGQLGGLSILVAYVLGLVLSVHLAHAAQPLVARAPDEAGDRRRMLTFVLAVATSPMLFLFGWITVYHETEAWAVTLALAALVCALRLVGTAMPGWAYGAAIASALCTLTRAPVGVGATGATLVALVIAYRTSVRRLAGPVAVALAGVAAHIAVNVARFGGPFDLPFSEQVLTRLEPERARWAAEHGNSFFGLEFVPSNLLHYLRPDALRVERVVPFLRFGPPATKLNGIEFESNTPATSLTLSATLLIVLAVIGVVWAVRARRFGLLAIIAATAAAGGPTLAFGFVANRYPIDFLPALALAGAFGVWAAAVPARVPVREIVTGLAAWSVLVNVSLGVWWRHAADPGFIEARIRLDEQLFDGRPPGVGLLAEATSETLYGTVVADADADGCHGIYIVGYKGWVAVERSQGARVLTGSVHGGDGRLVDTGAWTLDVRPTGEVVYSDPGTERVLATVDAPGEATVDYTLTVDPLTRERYGTVAGAFFYLPPSVLDGPDLTAGDPRPGPLCRLVSDRLGVDSDASGSSS
jgi:MFS family permease